MTYADWTVMAAGIAAILWVNWYFFLAQRSVATAFAATGMESGAYGSSVTAEVSIMVKGGYDPATIRVKAGKPVRLIFDRQETSGCSEEIVFPDFGVKKFLPAFQRTIIEVTPSKPGRYEFTCGMSMLRGALIAE